MNADDCGLDPWWKVEGQSVPNWAKVDKLDRHYWNNSKYDRDEQGRIAGYVQELLPWELWFAHQESHLPPERCDSLALLLGYSVEPLMQAIGVWQPARLVLLFSDMYGAQYGKARAEEVEGWIKDLLLPRMNRTGRMTICLHPAGTTPDSVFSALCDTVLQDQRNGKKRVVVDITGAKKSMDAGAFLFAAYAGIPISYVDVEYARDRRDPRPLGYTCRIGSLSNPYASFRLREWERVQHLYKNYQFREACQVLTGAILPAMQDRFTNEQICAAQKLAQLVGFYDAWDDGDHKRALALLPGLLQVMGQGFEPPLAVEALGRALSTVPAPVRAPGSNASEDAQDLLTMHEALDDPGKLFEDNVLLFAYARDELAKIGRLIAPQKDNRSALLRAAGLDEFLLKVRLVRAWRNKGYLTMCPPPEDSKYPTPCDVFFRKGLVSYDGARYMRKTLSKEPESFIMLEYQVLKEMQADGTHIYGYNQSGRLWDRERRRFEYRPAADRKPSRLAPYWHPWNPDTFVDLRNRAIHMGLYVTQEIAEAAFVYAQASLAEFEEHWTALGDGVVPPSKAQDIECLPWTDFLTLCKVDFLPLAFTQ